MSTRPPEPSDAGTDIDIQDDAVGEEQALVPDAAQAPRTRSRGGVIAIFVALVGVAVLAVMLTQGVFSAIVGGSDGSTMANYSAPVDGVTELSLDISAAEVEVRYGDVPAATLAAATLGRDWTFDVDGERLVVKDPNRPWFMPKIGDPQLRAELVLPLALEGQIDVGVELSAGAVGIVGDYRDVNFDVSAGAAVFDGASTSLTIDVSAGRADVSTDGPDTIEIDVSAGRVSTNVSGVAPSSTTVDVNAGSVVLNVPDGAYAVSGDGSAGERIIDVRTNPGSASTIAVDVSAGSAEVGYSD